MGIFRDLRVQLDPWQVDYGAELPLEIADQPVSDETVALDVEVAVGEWRPIEPGASVLPSQLIFVDGVRRIEARLIIRRQEELCHGAFGSDAVGAVTIANSTASYVEPRVGRLIVIGSGEALDDPVTVSQGLVYDPVSTLDSDPEAPLRTIQERMRLAEERLGRDLAGAEDSLVVADGPSRRFVRFSWFLRSPTRIWTCSLGSEPGSGRRFSRCDRASPPNCMSVRPLRRALPLPVRP
jgi:hypothetical protein